MINPITSEPYVQEFQEKNIEENQKFEQWVSIAIGSALAIIAAIWLIYFKKRIWVEKTK
jgi:hypothetical protein